MQYKKTGILSLFNMDKNTSHPSVAVEYVAVEISRPIARKHKVKDLDGALEGIIINSME